MYVIFAVREQSLVLEPYNVIFFNSTTPDKPVSAVDENYRGGKFFWVN
jgi:hypothetical protein